MCGEFLFSFLLLSFSLCLLPPFRHFLSLPDVLISLPLLLWRLTAVVSARAGLKPASDTDREARQKRPGSNRPNFSGALPTSLHHKKQTRWRMQEDEDGHLFFSRIRVNACTKDHDAAVETCGKDRDRGRLTIRHCAPLFGPPTQTGHLHTDPTPDQDISW